MSSDPNKKSARTFQCRDMLWETFEQMARELECSVDYLINEAMKQYARQRSYGQRTPYPGGGRGAESGAGGGYASAPPPMPPPQSMRGGGMSSRGQGGLPPPPARGGGLPAPPPPPRGMGGMAPPPRMGGGAGSMRSQPPSAPRSAPPPIPAGRSSGSMPPVPGGGFNGGLSAGSALSIIYQGEKHGVAKDRFVIGRGKQSSDLTLKDPNVSRQHAMIEYQNGVYFMVDMGSTNGVEYNGQRIARKQIAEGDVFRICDHDLRFTYR
ncbi:MAG: FHA domain-containing protein [Labilithrix sp.]|nr:FHA domain-containing protein [Labilithrix sp.]